MSPVLRLKPPATDWTLARSPHESLPSVHNQPLESPWRATLLGPRPIRRSRRSRPLAATGRERARPRFRGLKNLVVGIQQRTLSAIAPRKNERACHAMFRIKPTTLPRTCTSRLRIGSIASFSGWSLM